MDARVSARVPVEIKKRGDLKLKEIGVTVTDLVNAAYEYVIEHGALPNGKSHDVGDEPQVKTLSGVEAVKFEDVWRKRAVLETKAYEGANFKEMLDEARGDYYARFA